MPYSFITQTVNILVTLTRIHQKLFSTCRRGGQAVLYIQKFPIFSYLFFDKHGQRKQDRPHQQPHHFIQRDPFHRWKLLSFQHRKQFHRSGESPPVPRIAFIPPKFKFYPALFPQPFPTCRKQQPYSMQFSQISISLLLSPVKHSSILLWQSWLLP